MEWWQILLVLVGEVAAGVVVLVGEVVGVVVLWWLAKWLLDPMGSGSWFAPEEEEENNGDR